MRELFNFSHEYGFESTDNTQEIQEEMPVLSNDETVVDVLGDKYENLNDPKDINEDIPAELQAEIDAINDMAIADIEEGADVLTSTDGDPYHEVPGGVDLTNDTDETAVGVDKGHDTIENLNIKEVTGVQGSLDDEFRDEYEEAVPADAITSDPEQGVTTIDAQPIDAEVNPDAKEVAPVGATEIEGDDDSAIDVSGVVGTESEDIMEEEDEDEYDDDEDIEDEEISDEEEIEDIEVEEEEIAEVDETEEEPVEDVVEIAEESEDEITECKEEMEVIEALDVNLNLDSSALTEEKQEEAEENAEGTELELRDDAFANVSEATTVNDGTVETDLNEETVMSDVIETDDGEEDYHDGEVTGEVVEAKEEEAPTEELDIEAAEDDIDEVEEMAEEADEEIEEEIEIEDEDIDPEDIEIDPSEELEEDDEEIEIEE